MPAIMSGFKEFLRGKPDEGTAGDYELIYFDPTQPISVISKYVSDLSSLVTVKGYVVYELPRTQEYYTRVYTDTQTATAALHQAIAAQEADIKQQLEAALEKEPVIREAISSPPRVIVRKPYAGKPPAGK